MKSKILNFRRVNEKQKIAKLFAALFFSTGIFALVGALFTWGEGWLFYQTDLAMSLIPLADIIVTVPLSLLASYGIWRQKSWGIFLGLMTSGIYIFGSVQVYILIFWNAPPYPLQLIIPPIFGLGIAVNFLMWVIKQKKKSLE